MPKRKRLLLSNTYFIMKPYTLMLTIIIFLSACQQHKIEDNSSNILTSVDVTTQIQSANNKFMTAYNSQDAHRIATEIFAADAVIYPPGSAAVSGGPDVIEGFWQAVMDAGVHKAEIKTNNATQYGNIAIDVGSVKLYDDQSNLLDEAKYIVEWIKLDDNWKIIKDIWNSNQQ